MGAKDSTGSDVTAFVRPALDKGASVGHIAIADGENKKKHNFASTILVSCY
jgi:hypothetical protein